MEQNEALVRRLEAHADLTADDRTALLALAGDRPLRTAAKRDIVREGDPTTAAILLLGGWAARHKMLEDGRRQIMALVLPGDLCDLHAHLLGQADHSISAITPIDYVEVPHVRIQALIADRPAVRAALERQALVFAAMQREWTVSVGQRSAMERLGHLFCETFHRLRELGLTQAQGCELPMTQADMAEATGLTSVHVNRTLQEMRAEGLITLKGRLLEIHDLEALQQRALFSPAYLHLDGPGTALRRSLAPSARVVGR